MVKYVAKNDTVFNFKYYHAGDVVEGGELLDNNSNFKRVDGTKPAAPTLPEGQSEVNKPDEVAIRTRAKELKISNWHTKGVDKLLSEIAEAEAKLAAPTLPDGVKLNDQNVNNDPTPTGDGSEGEKSDK